MREPLQNDSDSTNDPYQRPNQPWVCGLVNEGKPCPVGPTARGVCPALAECEPVLEGDRWRCNRSALRGGPCDKEPSPEGACPCVNQCRPVRSLRVRRGQFVMACVLLVAGGLLMMLSADWRNEAISPGPLAIQHAQILKTGSQQCAACHAAADETALGWVVSLVVGREGKPTQSERCMECHEKTISPQFALAAHNVPAERLDAMHGENEGPTTTGSVACAACHQEHHGGQFDLKALDNGRCQACHTERYHSFAKDHPDFNIWPYERRTRIVFDHVAHLKKHFPKEKQSFDCQSCHVEDSSQKVQLLASYESACASCHDEKIVTSVTGGIPLLSLPSLDIELLQEAGLNVGPWPAQATGDFDGQLPPIMKWLLAADKQAARAMQTLGEDFELMDIDPEDAAHLQAAADLTEAIKRLFVDLSQSVEETLRTRLATRLGKNRAEELLQGLMAGLSTETMQAAVSAWLPNLTVDQRPASLGTTGPLQPSSAYGPSGTWFRNDTNFTLRYQPTSHADPLLASWLELLLALPESTRSPLESYLFQELTRPNAPGQCVSCHSIERTATGRLAIQWQAYDQADRPRGFTKFSHGPHLLLPSLADCSHCHALDESVNMAASYSGTDPHSFISEFLPISKRQCTECHTSTAAGDQCQSCHQYHVGAP